MRFMIISILMAAVLALNSCGDSKEMNAKEMKKNKEIIPVEVSQVGLGEIQDMLQFNATLETENFVKVFSRLEGVVVSPPLEEGTRVEKGQVLVRLDGREQKLNMQKAEINYRKQENEFGRIKALHKKELVSIDEYDKAKLTLDQFRVEYESAQLSYNFTMIKSPLKGVVSQRLIKMGDRVSPGMEVFEVVNLDEKIAKIYVPENYLNSIKKDIPALFSTDIMTSKLYGSVKRISPIVDPASGTFKVTVAVKDPKNDLKPGMFVNVQLITETHENALYVPKTSLVYDNDKAFFYTVLNDSIAIKHLLRKGLEDNDKVEVKNDVQAGDKIIMVGQSGLKDSAQVKIVKNENVEG